MLKKTLKQIFASLGIGYLAIVSVTALSLLTPAPAKAATAEEIVRFMGVLQRYITDLDKTMNNPPAAIPTEPQPAIPTEPQPDIPEPDTTEAQ
jgi:hypothetical protein